MDLETSAGVLTLSGLSQMSPAPCSSVELQHVLSFCSGDRCGCLFSSPVISSAAAGAWLAKSVAFSVFCVFIENQRSPDFQEG